jgi:hypothetical protein
MLRHLERRLQRLETAAAGSAGPVTPTRHSAVPVTSESRARSSIADSAVVAV